MRIPNAKPRQVSQLKFLWPIALSSMVAAVLCITGCDDGEVQTQYDETVEAQQRLEETREQVAEDIADAEAEAVETIQDAREDAADIVRDAKQDAAEEINRAEQNLQQELNELGEGPIAGMDAEPSIDGVIEADVEVDEAETVIIKPEGETVDNGGTTRF